MQVRTNSFNKEKGTIIVPGNGNKFRKVLAYNVIVKNWYYKHDNFGITTDIIEVMIHGRC